MGQVERNSHGCSSSIGDDDSASDNVNEEKKRKEAAGSRLRRSVVPSVGTRLWVGGGEGAGGRTSVGTAEQRASLSLSAAAAAANTTTYACTGGCS